MRQNGTIATGYTPKHAKPGSGHGKSPVNAPSVGRHAAVSAADGAAVSAAAESRSTGQRVRGDGQVSSPPRTVPAGLAPPRP
jgi:hypothetical protein